MLLRQNYQSKILEKLKQVDFDRCNALETELLVKDSVIEGQQRKMMNLKTD